MKGRMKEAANQTPQGMGGLLARTDKKAKHQHRQAGTALEASTFPQSYGERLLDAYQSENGRDQVQVLVDLYSEASVLRDIHHFHTLPRTRFLEQTRRFLESRGLVLDSVIERRFHDRLRKMLCATA